VDASVALAVLILPTGWVRPDEPSLAIRAETVWSTSLDFAGTSSPRAADLNGDGIEDVVIGTGVENRYGEVVALDGATGRILWSRRVLDEVVTTTPMLDVNRDGTADVFLGGRKRIRDVYALSGKDGQTLWRLTAANPDTRFPVINFISFLPVDDRNGDGLADLLVVQTGGADELRLAARFYVVDSASGSILASRVAPDGRESYSVPIFEHRAGEQAYLYAGTGGETLTGNLLKLRFPSFEEVWRLGAVARGFVASPMLVDLETDGKRELVATGMNGGVYCVDAAGGRVRWAWRGRPFFTYASPAVGALSGSRRPGRGADHGQQRQSRLGGDRHLESARHLRGRRREARVAGPDVRRLVALDSPAGRSRRRRDTGHRSHVPLRSDAARALHDGLLDSGGRAAASADPLGRVSRTQRSRHLPSGRRRGAFDGERRMS
jgi:hypothetical protein